MKLYKSSLKDLNDIMNIIKDAQNKLKTLNIDQWQDGYPAASDIINDINQNQSFIFKENDEIVAYVAIIFGNDDDYQNIYNGKWQSDEKYAVMHRLCIASKYSGKGLTPTIFDIIFNYIKANDYNYLRIDTHPDNFIMHKVLTSQRFQIAGDIYLARGHSLRIAYDIILS